MKLSNRGNKVVQFKLLLEEIKHRVEISAKKQYGAIYCYGRIEIIEFCEDRFVPDESNYKTRSYKFTTVSEKLYADLNQAWYEVFGEDIKLQIIE